MHVRILHKGVGNINHPSCQRHQIRTCIPQGVLQRLAHGQVGVGDEGIDEVPTLHVSKLPHIPHQALHRGRQAVHNVLLLVHGVLGKAGVWVALGGRTSTGTCSRGHPSVGGGSEGVHCGNKEYVVRQGLPVQGAPTEHLRRQAHVATRVELVEEHHDLKGRPARGRLLPHVHRHRGKLPDAGAELSGGHRVRHVDLKEKHGGPGGLRTTRFTVGQGGHGRARFKPSTTLE